jgi:hypothetical protein
VRPHLFFAQNPTRDVGKNAKNALAGLVAAGLIATAVSGGGRPAVAFVRGTPADVRSLAGSTWERFNDAFPTRRECLAPVTVRSAWKLDDRATYDPRGHVVTIRIPGTAPNLRATLVHEFAHHLEFTCPAQRGLRAGFLAAQGRSAGSAWFEGDTWERTPSEQFAEATTEFVLGRRPPHARIAVTPEALRVIETWANEP